VKAPIRAALCAVPMHFVASLPAAADDAIVVRGIEVAERNFPEAAWDPTRALVGDFNCDGAADMIALGWAPASAAAPGLVREALLVSVAWPTADRTDVNLLRLTIGLEAGRGLCAPEAGLLAEPLPPVLAADERVAASCTAVRVEDGRCPAIHVAWNPTDQTPIWWRQ